MKTTDMKSFKQVIRKTLKEFTVDKDGKPIPNEDHESILNKHKYTKSSFKVNGSDHYTRDNSKIHYSTKDNTWEQFTNNNLEAFGSGHKDLDKYLTHIHK